ncbi:hypothetical protein [Pelagimonas varians]|uniref:Membrane transport protein MerF n=1 Tax=Pelagimonas varians TaxID=696760 RepID=A0A238JV95_9RHOB|nr:hypothetical protein [Pelagimonas varians]PYG34426.1 hypothetical protein C8N36_10176 [Pelagimonas varians]SMX34107.1 hypothetical protein PEV8663_00390 [Pelagimonas varians]
MKLDRFVLIVVCCLAGAVATFWITTLILAAISIPFAWLALIPAAIAAYVVYRVIQDRLNSEDDDHYDKMEY